MFCKTFKELNQIFWIHNYWRELKCMEKVSPSIVNDFIIMFLLCKRIMSVVDQKIKKSL